MYEAKIYGPCDGLFYLSGGNFHAIWNPAINEVRTLPPLITKPDPPPNFIYSPYDFYGFGLDSLSGDYKVVVFKEYWFTTNEIVSYSKLVLVYALGNDSWKYCGDLDRDYSLQDNTCYIFVKGCCFWLGSLHPNDGDYREIIIAFDMASESFQEMPVPSYNLGVRNTLGMYDDSLAFFSVDIGLESLGIWTLKHSTWTKIFNIGPISHVRYPLGHWKSNKVILWCFDQRLVLCDPNTREIKDLKCEIDQLCEGVFGYMESLVSVNDNIKSRKDKVDWWMVK